MAQVGIRELKQNASAVVARVEDGESLEVTVQGRPVARLVPIHEVRRRWVPSRDVAEVLTGVGADETGWAEENRAFREEQPQLDPWDEG